MTTPWSVIFNKDILSWIKNDFIKFRSNNLNNWFGVVIWWLFRFKMWFDEEIESFKGKINFKNIQEYYQVKIIKLKKVDKTHA